MKQTPTSTIDYSECEKEPITTLGATQSYGALVVVRDGKVVAVSKNIEHFLAVKSGSLLNTNIAENAPELLKLINNYPSHFSKGETYFENQGQWLAGVRKEDARSFFVEFFPNTFQSIDLKGFEDEIKNLTQKLHYPAKDRAQFLTDLCHIFQKYLGFDQVFVQILQDGEIMEVAAEANNGRIEAVLGLLFSSKEIPSQARNLYLKQLIRFKQDSSSIPVDILSHAIDRIDLSHALLREPSKFMTVYMQNVLAATLLSTSLVSENKLTAILTMHNKKPLYLDPRIFDHVVAIVGKVSLELLRIDYLLQKNADSNLWELLMEDFPLNRLEATAQLIAMPRLTKFLSFAGAAVLSEGKIIAKNGDCPNNELIETVYRRAATLPEFLSHTSKLSEDYALTATDVGEFGGVMTIHFEKTTVMFFRKQFPLELKWRSATPEGFEINSNLPRFSPAGSFQFLVQEFQNQSRPWSEKDIAFGNVICEWISKDFES